MERDGDLVLGVMSAPAIGSRWYARRGGERGPWMRSVQMPGLRDGSRCRGSACSVTPSCSTRHRSTSKASGEAPGFDALVRSVWRDRGFGDFWGYALVAEGAAEAMVEVGPHSWDLAAPSVIVEEAGGRFTDLAGRQSIHTGNALATNGVLHASVLERLRAE